MCFAPVLNPRHTPIGVVSYSHPCLFKTPSFFHTQCGGSAARSVGVHLQGLLGLTPTLQQLGNAMSRPGVVQQAEILEPGSCRHVVGHKQ